MAGSPENPQSMRSGTNFRFPIFHHIIPIVVTGFGKAPVSSYYFIPHFTADPMKYP
jgi:hypothetical protein